MTTVGDKFMYLPWIKRVDKTVESVCHMIIKAEVIIDPGRDTESEIKQRRSMMMISKTYDFHYIFKSATVFVLKKKTNMHKRF